MKKNCCLGIILISLSIICSAQGSGNGAVVSANNMNVLYKGVQNPVGIAVPGIKNERVTASVTNGTIKKTDSGWEVLPSGQGDCTITVLVDNKKVSEKIFRVKNIPVPVAVFAGKNSGMISKTEALKTPTIEIEIPDFEWDLKFVVESFSLTTSNNIGNPLKAKGNRLTDEMISAMSQLKKDQKIIFEDIIAINPAGKKESFPPIVLKFE